ncbi:MAG: carbohydrate ABC transporter permease [Armatimonadota bacterium]|nr:carbohydrate ABC transporter permease [Armatimonadota bacterium]
MWRNTKVALTYIILIGLSCVFLIPFFWMLSTSLTEASKVIVKNRSWIPHPVVWKNYKDALTVLPFHLFLKNTLIITISCIIGQVVSASLVAFGFSRMRFPGRDAIFILVLSTMMLPAQVTQIPTFILFTHLRWIDTLKPLIVPAFFGGGAFFIFLLRQFFLTIPTELEDAAKIDGCSPFGVYLNVAIPLSKPALATVAVFSFMSHWNDFMGPLIYIQSMENKTLALGLASFKTLHGTEYHLMMAASVAVLMPVLIIFFCAQKYFVRGIVMSGLKG